MDNETCLPNWKKLSIKSCGWVVLFSPYLQQTISLLSPHHMRIHFQGHVLGVECSLSGEDSWLETGNKVAVFISGDHRRMENWLFHLQPPLCLLLP